MAHMTADAPGKPARDWLGLLPRDAWPEPWASMDTGPTLQRPGDVPDPETPDDLRRIDWPSGKPRELFIAYARWHEAVARAADDGDSTPLIQLLRSDVPLPRDARDLLADLHACRKMKRRPGHQAEPTRLALSQGALNLQAAAYHYWREHGIGHDDALRRALVDFLGEEIRLRDEEPPGADELAERVTDEEVERLDSHIRGKRGTTRRWRRRRQW
jgi:hypothetical protein